MMREKMLAAIRPLFKYSQFAAPDVQEEVFNQIVDEALAVLMQPTEAVVLEGYGTDDYVMGHDCEAIFKLMIQAVKDGK